MRREGLQASAATYCIYSKITFNSRIKIELPLRATDQKKGSMCTMSLGTHPKQRSLLGYRNERLLRSLLWEGEVSHLCSSIHNRLLLLVLKMDFKSTLNEEEEEGEAALYRLVQQHLLVKIHRPPRATYLCFPLRHPFRLHLLRRHGVRDRGNI